MLKICYFEIESYLCQFIIQMRAVLICQLCGQFYGEEQLKFYQHLRHHYDPPTTLAIDNPVPDIAIDKV